MKNFRRGAFENEDFERTDTLPMLPDEAADTSEMTAPPMAALPVDVASLAESLRERETQLEQAARRATELEARLAAASARCEQLQRECAALRAAVPPPATAPVVELPAPAEDPGLQDLRRQNARLHEALCSMHAQMGVREGQLAEAEEALREALRGPGRVELDWQARSAELHAELERERAAAAAQAAAQVERLAVIEAELMVLRARLPAPGEPAAAAAAPARTAAPFPIGMVLRVLVREEDGTEVVYPLGRHTTIGRTPDNDIQVNTTWVSRNHAVVLAGMDHCIVEDLNSTNGVLVNGHRVGRQLLNDGDIVTIGKTHFRFQQRP